MKKAKTQIPLSLGELPFFIFGGIKFKKYKAFKESKFLRRCLMEFLIKIHKSKYGYDVHCPLLPGCASQGETEAEAIDNIKDAIKEYLLAVKQVKKNEELRKVEVAI